ncbi:flagellar biosynthesis protein FlgJ [Mesorhizobium sp. NBSH29]|uniref:rod-binding protein n=1 Tax=Mesorhizobium sp. NBSH29 TaxID=2654249 RepID=UPI001896834B|nr:rod-binding protein [Mesorhizobium sp. NBSH29]QPC85413.1 flagellar biosynthesis protein FlgJ [Mesorhizobium sp. NBSH29]
MAISPPSDIVLDVARAAAPASIEEARAALLRRGGAPYSSASASFDAGNMRGTSGNANAAVPKTFVKFEAMVLQTFVQEMLPKQTEAVYGKGMAGDMWQSLLAQQLGDVIAERGGIGIAKSLLKDHYRNGEMTVALSDISSGPQKAESDRQNMLSTALVQEMQRKLAASLAEDASASMKK